MESESTAELVEEICELAKGPARPVLDEGVNKWLESQSQAIKRSHDLGERELPALWPLNRKNADFPTACAVLAAFHDKHCEWCALLPEPESGTIRHIALEMLRNDVSGDCEPRYIRPRKGREYFDYVRTADLAEEPKPRYIRNILDSVRAELRSRGVLPTGEDQTLAPTQTDEKRSEGEGDTCPKTLSGKGPPKAAWQAYYVRESLGITNQTEIAAQMTKQGTPATQGQVSKWLKAVDAWLKAGGIKPTIEELHEQPKSMDPAKLDMGERQDGRTPRQRHKMTDPADDWG